MSLGEVLLGVLRAGPAHGYDLKRVHDERFPASRELAYGQVYATLGRLERDALIEQLESVQDGGPARTVYALTDAGAHELESWLGQTEPPGPYAADELVRKTVTALYAGVDAADVLDRQRALHMERLRALTGQRRTETGVGSRIALDHAIAHLDADLRWLEDERLRVAEAHTPPPAADSAPDRPEARD